jgi:hypothetical protein
MLPAVRGIGERAAVLRRAQIDRMDRNGDPMGLLQFALGDLKVALRARGKVQVASLPGQQFGHTAADSLRTAGDKRPLAGELQIHDLPRPSVCRPIR